MVMQNKKWSLIETLVQVIVGYFIALVAQIIVFPLYGMEVSLGDNVEIGLIFLIVSLIRGYGIRRIFNRIKAR